jgi:hypothetical protein
MSELYVRWVLWELRVYLLKTVWKTEVNLKKGQRIELQSVMSKAYIYGDWA